MISIGRPHCVPPLPGARKNARKIRARADMVGGPRRIGTCRAHRLGCSPSCSAMHHPHHAGPLRRPQGCATVLRCHVAAFNALGCVPEQNSLRPDAQASARWTSAASSTTIAPRPGGPYRLPARPAPGQDQGLERPFRYVREDFFLARPIRRPRMPSSPSGSTRSANRRLHGAAGRHRHRALRRGAARPRAAAGRSLPVLRLEQRHLPRGHDLGRRQSPTAPAAVPSRCRSPPPRSISSRMARLVAVHPVLEGRGRRRIAEGHRKLPPPSKRAAPRNGAAAPPGPPAGAPA